MIEKVSYRLLIDGQEGLLLDYYVSHSIFTPSSKCVVLTDKEFTEGQKLYLELGVNGKTNKVFTGTIYKVEKYQNKFKLYADSIYYLRQNPKTISLKDVNPKQILNHIGIDKLIYTKKNLPEKHHFPILKLTPLQVIKQITKAWNLKDFVYYLDLEENLHFHHKDEYWDKTVKTDRIISQNTINTVSMPLFTGIFINQILEAEENYKVLSLTHTKGKTLLEIEDV